MIPVCGDMVIHLSVLTAEKTGANLSTHLRETKSSVIAYNTVQRVLTLELFIEVLLCGRYRVGGKCMVPLRLMPSEASQSSEFCHRSRAE